MPKQKTIFVCAECGYSTSGWMGRCPECGAWGSFAEEASDALGQKIDPAEAAAAAARAAATGGAANGKPGASYRSRGGAAQAYKLSEIDAAASEERYVTGVEEFDRVLGGGLVKGSLVLVGGDPGIGKSTLLLQLCGTAQAGEGAALLYVSGEESTRQLKMRATRLGVRSPGLHVAAETRLAGIERLVDEVRPAFVVVDSIQTMYDAQSNSVPGSVSQVRDVTMALMRIAKATGVSFLIVGHVTKEGAIAGPKVLEHMVDTVLYFEGQVSSAADGDCRFLRAAKNRFGSVDEIGIFTMGEKGLRVVEDPSLLFLVTREGALPPGVATAAVLEGSRTLLVEIQALTVPAKGAMSRVFSDRIDQARVSRVAAAIEKHLGLRLSDQDLYVNVAGGLRVSEVGVELALACAIYSARTGLCLPSGTAVAGELSLAGEVRPIRRLAARIKAAGSLGFTVFVGPAGEAPKEQGFSGVKDIKIAIKSIFG